MVLLVNKISVVVPTCNRSDTLAITLNSIMANTVLPDEIIIVDQGANNTGVFISDRSSNIKYIKDRGKGVARARNIGWKNAIGDIIAFTDDDALVDREWIKNILITFKLTNFNPGVIGGKIIPTFEEKNDDWNISEERKYILPYYDQGDAIELYSQGCMPPGVNYSTTKELLEKANGFNEMLGVNNGKKIQIYGEDTMLSFNIQAMGFDIIYNPNIIVYHPVPLSRQCNEFLKRRLFTEGLTSMYINRLNHEYSFRGRIRSIKNVIQQYYSALKNDDKQQSFELKSICKGQLFGLIMPMSFLSK